MDISRAPLQGPPDSDDAERRLTGAPGDPGLESCEREAARQRGELRARPRDPDLEPLPEPDARIARSTIPHRSFAVLADAVRDYAIFLIDPDGIITLWGEGARRMMGWTPQQAEGAHLRLLYVDGGSEDGTAEGHLRIAAETGEYAGEGHRIRSDGSAFWAQVSLTPLRDENGTLSGFAMTTRDITGKHEAELAREREREVLAGILENLVEGVVACDARGRLTHFNRAARELHGLPLEPVTQEEAAERYDLYLADGRTPMRPEDIPLYRALHEGGVREVEMVVAPPDRPAHTLLASGQPLYDARGEKLGAFVTMHDVTERKKAEQALRESQAALHAVLDASPDIIEMLDAEGRFRWVSLAMREVLGYPPEVLVGVPMLDLVHPEDGDRVNAALTEVADGRVEEIHLRYRALSRGGEWRVLEARGRAVRSENTPAIALVVRDMTERVRMEEALRESERSLATLMSNVPGSVYRCLNDPDWTIIYMSDGVQELTGYAVEEFVERRSVVYAELIHPDDQQRVWDDVQRALDEREKFQTAYRIRTRDGEEKWVWEQGQGVFEDGALMYLEGFVVDITPRVRAEETLRESEERFRQLTDNIREVFWMVTADFSQVLYVSPAYETIWGRSSASLYQNARDRMAAIPENDRERVKAVIDPDLVREHGFDAEYRIRRPDGEIRWVHDRGFPVRNEAGEVYRFAGIAEDITERKRTEARIQAQLAEKTALLNEVHHRVKNNLQIISSLLNMQIRTLRGADAVEALRESQSRTRAIALVHETLYRSGNFGQIDLSDYFRQLGSQIQRSYGTGGGIELRMELQPAVVPLDQAVPCGLILNELITNAFKHAFPSGGTGAVRVHLTRTLDQRCLLSVSDNGAGIPEDQDMDNLRSVGLKLVHLLSQQIGAELEIRRRPGAQFRITFPAGVTP